MEKTICSDLDEARPYWIRPRQAKMPRVFLQSYDEDILLEDVQLVKCSKVIRDMLSAHGPDLPIGTVLSLKGVHSHILRKILHWAEYHVNDASPAWDPDWRHDTNTPIEIPDWDGEFLREDMTTLFKLIAGADYLDIKWLFALVCQKVANKCADKTPLQMRRETMILPKLQRPPMPMPED